MASYSRRTTTAWRIHFSRIMSCFEYAGIMIHDLLQTWENKIIFWSIQALGEVKANLKFGPPSSQGHRVLHYLAIQLCFTQLHLYRN